MADEGAIVVCGNARFTILTSRLIRMEWSENGKFEDRATLGVVNRNLDVPEFSVRRSKSKLVIKTNDLTLTYFGQDMFGEENLTISFEMTDMSSKKGTFEKELSEQIQILSGKKGLFTRMTLITPEAKLRFSQMHIADIQLPSELMSIAQGGSFITEDPANAEKYLDSLDIDAMNANLQSWEKLSDDFKSKVAAQTHFEK